MTKGKLIQIVFLLALVGFIILKMFPEIGYENIMTNSISSIALLLIIFLWVFSYLYRVINGKMTFIEQRKRYRAKYDKFIDEKLQNKFNSLPYEEQEKLLKDLEEK